MYLYVKNKDASTLAFFIATLCFMFQGIALDAGLAIEIPVLLSLFGMIFTGLMFVLPDNANPSSIGSSLRLEKQLDITNEELKRTQEKLLKTERLAAIGELAGMIGHDLRTPLQGITGATYYLKIRTSPKLNETEREMIETIETCIQRSNKIINDLLEYSREIYLDYEVTTPKVLLSDTLRQLELPKRINLINETKNEPDLRIDKGKIERVFVNIIRNAFEAMPETGTLTISSKAKDDKVVFTFKDTGVGITKEALSKLWTPLYTTKATGMGFGLAICKRIIEAHNGEIRVESEPGMGATFTVTFPQMPRLAIYGQNMYLSTPEITQKTNALIAATKRRHQ